MSGPDADIVHAGIFDPGHYAKVRRPVMQAETLPGWCYTSQEFYDREVERIFKRCWNFVDRVDRIPNAGDYFVFDYVGISTIVMRGHDGAVRAFANTCRHRGSRLLQGEGCVKAVRCPYHAWSYATDGRLIACAYMDMTEDFDPAEYGLLPVRLEVWGGFMFLNFDPDAKPLATQLGDLIDVTAGYPLDGLACVWRHEIAMACNWKLFYENFAEQYHIPFVHKGSLYRQKREIHPPEPADGDYVALYVKHAGSRMLLAGDQGFPPIPDMANRSAEGTFYPSVHPSTMMGLCNDGMWFVRTDPLGPESTRIVIGLCLPEAVRERPDYETILPLYQKRFLATVPEDVTAAEEQQRGLRSPYYRPGRLSYLEQLVHTIDNWVLDRVIGNLPPSEVRHARFRADAEAEGAR